MSIIEVTSTFTGTGQSSTVVLAKDFNLSLSGTFVATVAIQRSFDDGATWKTVESYTAEIESTGFEPEGGGALYRLNCTAYTSGTVTYRLSR